MENLSLSVSSNGGIESFMKVLKVFGIKVDARLPGKGDSKRHGARPVIKSSRWYVEQDHLRVNKNLSLF